MELQIKGLDCTLHVRSKSGTQIVQDCKTPKSPHCGKHHSNNNYDTVEDTKYTVSTAMS